jgi:hypothetical protein
MNEETYTSLMHPTFKTTPLPETNLPHITDNLDCCSQNHTILQLINILVAERDWSCFPQFQVVRLFPSGSRNLLIEKHCFYTDYLVSVRLFQLHVVLLLTDIVLQNSMASAVCQHMGVKKHTATFIRVRSETDFAAYILLSFYFC